MNCSCAHSSVIISVYFPRRFAICDINTIKPPVSTETVRHSSTNIVLYPCSFIMVPSNHRNGRHGCIIDHSLHSRSSVKCARFETPSCSLWCHCYDCWMTRQNKSIEHYVFNYKCQQIWAFFDETQTHIPKFCLSIWLILFNDIFV